MIALISHMKVFDLVILCNSYDSCLFALKDQRALGMSMRVERASLEQVR